MSGIEIPEGWEIESLHVVILKSCLMMMGEMMDLSSLMMINLSMARVGTRNEKVPPWMIGKRQPKLL